MKKKPTKKEKEEGSMYCPVCGTCGYIGCCGVKNFLEIHVRGKTDCQEEAQMIKEIINCCEPNYEEENN